MTFAMLMLTVENTSNTKCSRSLPVLDAERDNKRCSHKTSFTFSPSSIKRCVFFTHSFLLCACISFCTLRDSCQTNQSYCYHNDCMEGNVTPDCFSERYCCWSIFLSHSCATIYIVLFRQAHAMYLKVILSVKKWFVVFDFSIFFF